MAAFRRLNEIIQELKNYNLSPNDAKCIKAVVDNLRYFYNAFLKYEIKETSDCEAFCLQWALSDPENEEFSKPCSHVHSKESWHVNNLLKMIQAIAGSLDDCCNNGDMTEGEWREYSIDISNAYKNIWKFHSHLMRSIHQNNVWSKLMHAADGKTAFVVIDNPMVCIKNHHGK